MKNFVRIKWTLRYASFSSSHSELKNWQCKIKRNAFQRDFFRRDSPVIRLKKKRTERGV